jgi:uncharacterized protein YegP (UPF0339 family)
MHFEIYKDSKGNYRWRLVARNGNIVADSAEDYGRKAAVKRMITRIAEAFDGEVEVQDLHNGAYTGTV